MTAALGGLDALVFTGAVGDLTRSGAGAATLVISAREDLEIARQVRSLLSR